jgi:hypothetical protein
MKKSVRSCLYDGRILPKIEINFSAPILRLWVDCDLT